MWELDKHQKSVLSDEWGVGVALEWLTNVFQYLEICHGDAAVRELRRRKLLKGYPTRKRIGPNKCPDFVAVDAQRKLHIIECKGTTKGRSTIKQAFKTAYEQKHAIRFKNDNAFVSQRLSVGLAVATNRRAKGTTLYVEDPEERLPRSEGGYVISDDAEPRQIEEAIFTSMLIEYSALAGAFDVLAAASSVYEDFDIGTVLAGRELPTDMIKFEVGDTDWIGQRFEALSPVALNPNHRRSKITIRSAMSARLRDSLLAHRVWREPEHLTTGMLERGLTPQKKETSDESALHCSIQFGDAFISDLSITDLRG